MTQQYVPNLGEQPSADARRDCVHVAVAPVIASHNMLPGVPVGLLPDGRAAEEGVKHIGVVDPFVKDHVNAGERFWLFLFPNSVTSLRHVWQHPSFVVKPPEKANSSYGVIQPSSSQLPVNEEAHDR